MATLPALIIASLLFTNTPATSTPLPEATPPAVEESLIIFEQTPEEKLAEEKLAEEKLAEEKLAEEKLAEEKLAEEKAKQPFGYVVASSTTYYSQKKSDYNRNYNMLLACQAINGVVLNPGESLSYNDVILSKRDKNNDYLPAGIIVGGKITNGIGGGICQVSSTLYDAALLSNMTITNRRNHSLMVGYLPPGRDATVSWGTIDFEFRNDFKIPVKIQADIGDGVLKIKILSNENPNVGDIKIVTTYQNGSYFTTRYVGGVSNYSAKSTYRSTTE